MRRSRCAPSSFCLSSSISAYAARSSASLWNSWLLNRRCRPLSDARYDASGAPLRVETATPPLTFAARGPSGVCRDARAAAASSAAASAAVFGGSSFLIWSHASTATPRVARSSSSRERVCCSSSCIRSKAPKTGYTRSTKWLSSATIARQMHAASRSGVARIASATRSVARLKAVRCSRSTIEGILWCLESTCHSTQPYSHVTAGSTTSVHSSVSVVAPPSSMPEMGGRLLLSLGSGAAAGSERDSMCARWLPRRTVLPDLGAVGILWPPLRAGSSSTHMPLRFHT